MGKVLFRKNEILVFGTVSPINIIVVFLCTGRLIKRVPFISFAVWVIAVIFIALTAGPTSLI